MFYTLKLLDITSEDHNRKDNKTACLSYILIANLDIVLWSQNRYCQTDNSILNINKCLGIKAIVQS